jgi:hypothetical protein
VSNREPRTAWQAISGVLWTLAVAAVVGSMIGGALWLLYRHPS